MSAIFPGRYTARREGPFILFLIGMRVHRPWAPWEWLPVFSAMPGMMREVAANPDSGFLGAESFISLTNPLIVQYWKDFDSLLVYAHDRDGKHFPAWARFNREVGPAVVYTHPWEIDPESPKLPGTHSYVRFFNGVGRRTMAAKLARLARELPFAPLAEVYAKELASDPTPDAHALSAARPTR